MRALHLLCGLGALAACSGSTTTGGVLPDGGSAGGPACASANVTIQVNAAQGSAAWCLGQPGGCASEWLSIRNGAGSTLLLSSFCITPCDTCQMPACPDICRVASELPASGTSRTWDGNYFAQGTCGAATSCVRASCAPAGRYTASVCGFPNPSTDGGFGCASADGTAKQTCVDVPFDYPSSGPVVATMPAL